ncbi:glycosyltransferase family 39 protein [Trichothermofontia sichuanensis B231]|uniref:glycosyltransferase family 39 protein n=1 Tax=Trichothermofontia sichuanensis TaxID=3045816 RepID=UPI002246B2D8|nr:glycosyltransferase family 39 protein [Trichothermofontia sichuanensis]UZQ54392.1 glycosyltransferase family 39 protein [Trichothermofontia sichuanensis B231]
MPLLLAIALGTGLRFWRLAAKPLWLDEILTALFSLGQSYQVVPLAQTISFSDLLDLFHLQPTTCAAIAATVTQESTHPPLFFCWMHQWLSWLGPAPDLTSLTWQLRSFPALMGVLLIGLLYWLHRVAFGPWAGIWGAMLMAVSPFAVYLSQEARHYTLPMVWLTLALICLIQIQRDLYQSQRFHPPYWLGWIVANSLGLYTHYFFLMAVVAQVGVLLGRSLWERRWLTRGQLGVIGLAIGGVGLAYGPWLATLQGHADRGETSWLQLTNPFAPIYQTVLTWVAMVVALPVENQPWWIVGLMGILTLGFLVWLGRVAVRGGVSLWRSPTTHLETWTLLGFIVLVLLQFWAIAYGLNRDITIAPRYSFVYYPAVCTLLAAACWQGIVHTPGDHFHPSIRPSIFNKGCNQNLFPIVFFILSLLSSLFVIWNLTFTKPFQPQRVAYHLGSAPDQALMIAIGYKNFQDVALGLSFALALPPFYPQINQAAFAFLQRIPNYDGAWQTLATLPHPPTPLNLWVISPELRRRDYPAQLTLANGVICAIDPQHHYRVGIPYQRYYCPDQRKDQIVHGTQ